MMYTPRFFKYQLKLHLSPWFSAACTAATAKKHFFGLYQRYKFFGSKVKFRHTSNH